MGHPLHQKEQARPDRAFLFLGQPLPSLSLTSKLSPPRRGTWLAPFSFARGRMRPCCQGDGKHMKKSVLLLSLVFVAGVAVADEAKKPEAPKAPEKAVATKTEAKAEAMKPVAEAGKTH